MPASDAEDGGASPEVTPEQAQALGLGWHPMVTPATVFTLVHAVRRPLRDPKGPIRPERGAGQTFALLAGPWNATGRGEMLGVVVAGSSTPPPELWPVLTQVGRDPIWARSGVPSVPPDPGR
ncbi:MAG: hypothetical protein ACR2HV_06770 [Acidimicrobiales bacterium]